LEVEMTTALVSQDKSLLVEAKERRQATELFKALAGHPERLAVESAERPVGLPPELASILATVVEVMARGGSVTIGSLPEELTTTVAAEQLGISRPTLMKMIQNGEIPAHLKGTHHRLKLSDVLAVKRARLERQRQAFDELRALEDELDKM
jgi:excisionase family DNA binding protein